MIASGNACVVLAAEPDPCVGDHLRRGAGHLRRPGRGGQRAHRPPRPSSPRTWPRTRDVNALDLTGADAELRPALERAAAETVKRVYVPRGTPDFAAAPGTARLRAFLETKTVWHPTGALSLAGGAGY